MGTTQSSWMHWANSSDFILFLTFTTCIYADLSDTQRVRVMAFNVTFKFQQYCGGNRRRPPIWCKSLRNFIT